MSTLSIAMIVKNEEAQLARCLGSIRGLWDELIVVDTGSEDGTVEFAASFGARIARIPWPNDFSAARNASLDLCRGEWVLVLDADEGIEQGDHAAVRMACAQDAVEAYRLRVRNYFSQADTASLDQIALPNRAPAGLGHGYPFFADFPALRLFRRHPWARFQGRVHELVDPCFRDRGLPVGDLDATIHHFGKTLADREAHKTTTYLEMARTEVEARPESHQAHFNLLQQALRASDWPTALLAARTCRALNPGSRPIVRLGTGLALQHLGDQTGAIAEFKGLLAEDPSHTVAWLRLGVSLAASGAVAEARDAFLRARRSQPDCALAYVNAAELEAALREHTRAEAILEEGLAVLPANPFLWETQIRQDLGAQDLVRAGTHAEAALERCPEGGRGLWHRLAALKNLQAGRRDRAAHWLQMGLARYPEDADLVRLRSLAEAPTSFPDGKGSP